MNNSHSFSLRPKVTVLLSDPSLGSYLVESLLANFCEVSLVVLNVNYWKEKLKHLSENSNLKIYEKNFLGKETVDYLIVSSDFFSNEKDIVFLNQINKSIHSNTSVLTIMPLANESQQEKKISLQIFKNFSFVQNLKTIFLGDLFGPRMVLGNNAFSEKLRQIVAEGSIEVGSEQLYFPVFAPLVAKQIVKSLFSFGVREGVFYYSHEIKESEIPAFFRRYFPALVAKGSKGERGREFFNVKKRFLIETPIKGAYWETFQWFVGHSPEIVKKIVEKKAIKKEIKIKLPKIHIKKPKLPKVNLRLPVSLLLVLALPFFILGSSFLSLGAGVSFFKKSNIKVARYFFNYSRTANSLTSGVFLFYTKAPLVGNFFESSYKLTRLVDKSTEVFVDGTSLAQGLTNVFENILLKKDSDLEKEGNELSNLSQKLYVDLGFIESESKDLGIYKKTTERLLEKVDLENIRGKLLLGEDVFRLLPQVLGKEKAMTYMVLFQNNMEIRPTGGFIGSFALVTINNGKLGEFQVYDVYDADGQLKGYVAPPAPIRNFLGEAAWYMRDANWDPDFPSSAAKIEWFLGKELGKSVDGVIGVDLSVAHSLVSGVGGLYLSDFSKEITVDNFYEETQKAAESDFFPGSDKKRNFLTALSRALVLEITQNGIENKNLLARNLLNDLEGKHIQFSFNNQKVKEVMGETGLDGGFNVPVCSMVNCQTDFLSIVDANVGVNKANFYVRKNIELNINEYQETIESRLTLTYKNSAKEGTGNSFKNYLRVVIPVDSEISYIESDGQRLNFDQENISGRKEVGVYLEVPEDAEKPVNFVWRRKNIIKSGEEGEYQFFLRKQAGSYDDPVFVSFNLSGMTGFESGGRALTNEPNFRYNTTLGRDILSQIKINK